MVPTSSTGTCSILSDRIQNLKCSLRSPQLQRLLSWIVSLVTILDFLLLGVSTTYEMTIKTLYLFMCKVQDDGVASWWVASLPWCVVGGRGLAAPLAEMVALLFYNTNKGASLLHVT